MPFVVYEPIGLARGASGVLQLLILYKVLKMLYLNCS